MPIIFTNITEPLLLPNNWSLHEEEHYFGEVGIISISKSIVKVSQYFSCQLISTNIITFLLISAKLMLIIPMFASPPLPHSPAQQNVEKFLRNGITFSAWGSKKLEF